MNEIEEEYIRDGERAFQFAQELKNWRVDTNKLWSKEKELFDFHGKQMSHLQDLIKKHGTETNTTK